MTYDNIHPYELYKINDNDAIVNLADIPEKRRDKAFIYIGGNVVTDVSHVAILKNSKFFDPVLSKKLSTARFLRKKADTDIPVAMGHICCNNVAIIDPFTVQNCTVQEIKSALMQCGYNKVYIGTDPSDMKLSQIKTAKKRLFKKVLAEAEKEDTIDEESSSDENITEDVVEEKNLTLDDDPYMNFKDKKEDQQPQTHFNQQLLQNSFQTLANEGRGVLKRIEDYKFKLVQTLNIFNHNEEIKTKIEQKQKMLNAAAAQIYGMVFDFENFDLTPNYEDAQFAIAPKNDEDEDLEDMSINDEENLDLGEETADNDNEDEDEDMDLNDFLSGLDEEEGEIEESGNDENDEELPSDAEEEDIKMQGGFEIEDEEEMPKRRKDKK